MVGVQLQEPASVHQGYAIVSAAKTKLQTHFGNACKIVKDDQSSIRLQLRWEHSKFTLTLTCNTAYIYIQGPGGKVLPLAQSIQDVVGGVVYIARQPGTAPRNPSEPEPEFTTTVPSATNVAEPATAHGAIEPTEAATHNASQIAAGAGTSVSSSTITSSPITGNDNIQVGTLVINAQTQDGEENTADQNAMQTLINGMMNLLRRGASAP